MYIVSLQKQFVMSKEKPSIPKGTRDFGPDEMNKRNYIFDTIKKTFSLYAYQPIETPAMEQLSSLLGKYGEEGDKLLFKILNSGDFLAGVDASNSSLKLASQICEKGLRYDLTVPFARFVVMHQNEITFPFKRYQLQPVWRADRPQKGRYREFYQCDVDVVGSNSLLNEAELLQITEDVFEKLGVNIVIKLNNRKILSGIAEIINEPDRITDITVAIDKIEKIGIEKVNEELISKGISSKAIENLQPILLLSGENFEKLAKLEKILSSSPIGLKGIEELKEVLKYSKLQELKTNIEIDLTLARGLNYYTGIIIEVKAEGVSIGSICGGGRYDNLTGIFGLDDISGVGISFGADRIYDVMEELALFPKDASTACDVLFINFGEKESAYCLPMLKTLRKNGIASELYPDSSKMKKQMLYADRKKVKFVVLAGEDEVNSGTLSVKNMITGEQNVIKKDKLIEAVK